MKITKQQAHFIAKNLLFYLFIYDALQNLLNNGYKTWYLKHRYQNLETSLWNDGLWPFGRRTSFKGAVRDWGSLIIYTLGILQLIPAVILCYIEKPRQYSILIRILQFTLVLDSLVLHNPYSETNEKEKTLSHFFCNFALIGCLMMYEGIQIVQ